MAINVRARANRLTKQVNPNVSAVLRANLGYIVDDYGKQIPSFEEHEIELQAQSLESSDLDHLDLINRQGYFISAYAFGQIGAIRRYLDKGASEIIFTAWGDELPSRWKVDRVLESFPTWAKVLLWRQ